jgi:acetyl-CoA carboxylase carboxyl transferase subunit beta
LREASEKPLPLDAHTAEAHLAHGLLDNVVDRENLQSRLATLLKILTNQKLGKGNFKELLKLKPESPPVPDAWEAVMATRHAERPSAMLYIRSMLDPFFELHGDRLNSDDRSIVGGIGFLSGEPVAIIGQQRHSLADGERYHTFPDGLRKAQRIIKLATRFKLPLVTLIDTQGAAPGLEAEEQGIGNAIANTMSLMADAPIPVVSVIIGEGGSEGALTLGVSDRSLMQQFAIYSPVSLNRTFGGPYPDPLLDREAAEALMLTANDCQELGIIDAVVAEPEGGSHTNPREAALSLQVSIIKNLAEVSRLSQGKLLKRRYKKFRQMGELNSYAKEAMDREVELLMNISTGSRRRTRSGRAQRKRASEEPAQEAPVSPLE